MRPHIKPRKRRRDWRLLGQSTLEFAIVFPIFIVLMLGLVDLARYYFYEQSISHTLREAGRYAVTGQLMENSDYNPDEDDQWPLLSRRESIIEAARLNNPVGIPIIATASSYQTNDNFTIMSSANFDGPWDTASTTGQGDDYVRLTLSYDFTFITPFLNLIASNLSNDKVYRIRATLIMRNESFRADTANSVNAQGVVTNYWN